MKKLFSLHTLTVLSGVASCMACPMCLPLYGAIFGLLGANTQSIFFWILCVSMSLSLILLLYMTWRYKKYIGLCILGCCLFLVSFTARFVTILPNSLVYISGAGFILVCIVHKYKRKRCCS